jgi:tRNA nucleotidyltransferase (CCA-adding enzyme)
MEKIFTEVIKRYKVSSAEYDEIRSKAGSVMEKIKEMARKKKYMIEVVLGGSLAKGTILKNDFDVDLFVIFELCYSDRDLSTMLESLIYEFRPERVHGSRDYFNFTHKGINYEIVPVLKISDVRQAANVTDMSPLHVKWIKEKTKGNKNLVDEIILAKVFCKANRLYGAESYIRGFSGHVLDILIIYYGSFVKLLQGSGEWKKNQVIDVEKHGDFSKLNESKISPLIVIDPVYPMRNASNALSLEKMMLFKKKAKDFLAKPTISFFEKKTLNLKDIRKKHKDKRIFFITMNTKPGKKDIVGARLLKCYEHILKQLQKHEFEVISSDWEYDCKTEAVMYFVLPPENLDMMPERPGPPAIAGKNAERFKEKHKDAYERKGRLYAKIKRDFVDPARLIDSILKSGFIRSRTTKTEVKR